MAATISPPRQECTFSSELKQDCCYGDRDPAACWDGRNEQGETVESGVYLYEAHAGERRDVTTITRPRAADGGAQLLSDRLRAYT